MVRALDILDLDSLKFLLLEFSNKEDNDYKFISKRSDDELIELLTTGHAYGKFLNNKLIGLASFIKHEKEFWLNRSIPENKKRKQLFYDENNITDDNTAIAMLELVLSEYRGEGYFNELYIHRMNVIKDMGFTNIVAYKTLSKIEGINSYIKKGWSIGTFIKTRAGGYEILLHYKL